MAYERQTWDTGTTISKSKLEHMEDGIYQNSEDISELNTNLAAGYQIMGIDNYSAATSGQVAVDDSADITINITTYDGCSYLAVQRAVAWGAVHSINISNGVLTVTVKNPYSAAHTITAYMTVIAYKRFSV